MLTVPAEIGGYMGLCLGASILTWFELGELVWDYCAKAPSRKQTSVVDSGDNAGDNEHGLKDPAGQKMPPVD